MKINIWLRAWRWFTCKHEHRINMLTFRSILQPANIESARTFELCRRCGRVIVYDNGDSTEMLY